MNDLQLQSTAGALADRLRADILARRFSPGEPLRQEEIAARYGVSRSPFREALRRLEAEGWIDYFPNRGAFVALVGARDVRDLYQIRRIVEPAAGRLSVNLLDDEGMARLRHAHLDLRRSTDLTEFVRLHVDFHQALYAAVGNRRLQEAISRNYVRVQRLPEAERRIRAVRKQTRSHHTALLTACEVRDARAAERAIIAELKQVERIMLDGLSG